MKGTECRGQNQGVSYCMHLQPGPPCCPSFRAGHLHLYTGAPCAHTWPAGAQPQRSCPPPRPRRQRRLLCAACVAAQRRPAKRRQARRKPCWVKQICQWRLHRCPRAVCVAAQRRPAASPPANVMAACQPRGAQAHDAGHAGLCTVPHCCADRAFCRVTVFLAGR